MQKVKLEEFINKYNLGGEIESVLISSADSTLSVSMISDDRIMLGDVTVDDVEFPNGEFPIYLTSLLKGLLSILDDDITVEKTTSTLRFSDGGSKVQYMLASNSAIPDVPKLKQLPEFNAEVVITNEFVNKFIKAKSVLTDVDVFTFSCNNGSGDITLSQSTTDSNKISMSVQCECDEVVHPIGFSAKHMKNILLANRGFSTASLRISSEGLAHLQFTQGEYTSNYYLVELK